MASMAMHAEECLIYIPQAGRMKSEDPHQLGPPNPPVAWTRCRAWISLQSTYFFLSFLRLKIG